MTATPHADTGQHADEDLAADLRDHGHTWPDIADTLGTTIAGRQEIRRRQRPPRTRHGPT